MFLSAKQVFQVTLWSCDSTGIWLTGTLGQMAEISIHAPGGGKKKNQVCCAQ
jgi:hypothetical protein